MKIPLPCRSGLLRSFPIIPHSSANIYTGIETRTGRNNRKGGITGTTYKRKQVEENRIRRCYDFHIAAGITGTIPLISLNPGKAKVREWLIFALFGQGEQLKKRTEGRRTYEQQGRTHKRKRTDTQRTDRRINGQTHKDG